MAIEVDPEESGRGPARPKGWTRRRFLLVPAVLVLFVVVAAAVMISRVSLGSEAARSAVAERLEELVGLPVTIAGPVEYRLLPVSQLKATTVLIGSGGREPGERLEIDQIVATLDLVSALLGRVEVTDLVLVRPAYRPSAAPAAAPTPRDPPSAIDAGDGRLELLGDFSKILINRFAGLETLVVRDGVFRPRATGGSFGISNANLRLAWPSETAPAHLAGSYVWNGQPTQVDLTLASPARFVAGKAAAVSFSLSAPALQATFEGAGSFGSTLFLEGALRLEAQSLPRAVAWLGDESLTVPDFGPIAVDAELAAAGSKVNLRAADIAVAGNDGLGAIELALLDGRPVIGGTLAFDRLDLTPFVRAVAPLPENPFDFNRPLAVRFISALDMDLRLSATSASVGEVPLSEMAATLKLKDGLATLDLGEAGLYGGQGQARLTIDANAPVPVANGQMTLTDVDSAGLLTSLGVSAITVAGRSRVNVDVTSPFTTWAALIDSSVIDATVSARDGSLSGFDPALLQAGTTPSSALVRPDAKLPFKSLEAKLLSNGALVDIRTVHLVNESGDLVASGVFSALTGAVNVVGRFIPSRSPDRPSRSPDPRFIPSKPVRFTVGGEWPNPVVTTGPPDKPI